MLLGFTTKCGLLEMMRPAAPDCLSPAMLDATHLNIPLSVGNVSRILRLPVSVIVILEKESTLGSTHRSSLGLVNKTILSLID